MMLGPATAPDEAQGAPHRRVEDCSWLDDDASLGARRDHLIGLDAAGKRQRAVDERRLDHAVAEQRGAPVEDGQGRDQVERAAVGAQDAAFVGVEVEQVEFDASPSRGGDLDQAAYARQAAEGRFEHHAAYGIEYDISAMPAGVHPD